MGFVELFLIGVGLSMDAFAVSVCKGLNMKTLNRKHALVIGLFFGGFQGIMPLLGWLLGKQFERYITGSPLYCWRSSGARWCGRRSTRIRRRSVPSPGWI